jgi:hypothetical protein
MRMLQYGFRSDEAETIYLSQSSQWEWTYVDADLP